ncbi:MAG: hypothetical protein BMS9Abin15_0630 [Gammaproteobacteria bacterium]|nr:MAG: hypothetical protein BMS9Abin15_0630 [Gammaproteobacteria bacterium]
MAEHNENQSPDIAHAHDVSERPDEFLLGQTNRDILLETCEDHQIVACAMVKQAHATLRIFTRNLDPAIFNTADFVDATKVLALRSRFSKIQILVQDSEKIAKSGHKLVDLARHLSTFFEIRKPSPHYSSFNEAFILVDKYGVIHRQFSDRFEGIANFYSPMQAVDLAGLFNEVWGLSSPDPETRRIYA